MKTQLVALLLLGSASVLKAEDKPDLCSERPGLTTDECVIDGGHLVIETGLADWTLDRQAGERTDTVLIGDSLLRFGIGHGLELRFGWTPFGYERERDEDGVGHYRRAGDITLGVKQNFIDDQDHGGVGPSLALIPFATIPVGRQPIGAGTWGAGAQLPFGYRFAKDFKIEYTTTVEAAPDDAGNGRHLRYTGSLGAKYNISEPLSLEIDEEVERDRDPDRQERGTFVRTGLSAAYQAGGNMQFDFGTNIGNTHRTPDAEIYAGLTRMF